MPKTVYTPNEVAARGHAFYEDHIRSKVEPGNKGKFLVLDIETGEYEIDVDHLTATKRVLVKRPDAMLFGLRIGHRTAYRLGGRFIAQE